MLSGTAGFGFLQVHPSGIQVDTGAWHELDRALFRSSIEQRFGQPSLCFEKKTLYAKPAI
jgi:hypothetical protein